MKTEKLIDIIEQNYRLGDENKLALLGALQELEQYRNNPLSQMQPCWKYVRENDINMQLNKMLEECKEFDQAQSLEEMSSEWLDMLQTSLTGVAILVYKYGVNLKSTIIAHNAKNDVRGYFEKRGRESESVSV